MGKHSSRDKLEIVSKEKDTRLFQGIIAFISLTIPPPQFKKVKDLLISNGAQVVSTDGNSVNCHICKDVKVRDLLTIRFLVKIRKEVTIWKRIVETTMVWIAFCFVLRKNSLFLLEIPRSLS